MSSSTTSGPTTHETTTAAFARFNLGPTVQRGIVAAGFVHPRPIQEMTIPAANLKIEYFEGTISIFIDGSADAAIKPGMCHFKGRLTYQGCKGKDVCPLRRKRWYSRSPWCPPERRSGRSTAASLPRVVLHRMPARPRACEKVIRDEKTGEVIELHCTYDPATRGGDAPDNRKAKATLHWVSARHAVKAEVRLYNTLFTKAEPGAESDDFLTDINPDSLEVLNSCFIEPGIAGSAPGSRFQFERMGYFCVDKDSEKDKLVFNRTVTLKDTWAKIEKGKK